MGKIHSDGSSKEDFYSLILTCLVEEWLKRAGVTDEKVLDEITRLQNIAKSSRMGVTVAYHWMYYMFLQNRKNALYKECRSVDDIAKMLLKNAGSLYEVKGDFCCVENPQFLGFLCALGYDEAVSAFLTDSPIDYKRHYEMMFDLLENNVSEEEARILVHNSYCEFGPQAHIVWWKRNLSNYRFYGKSAEIIEQNAKNVIIDANADLASQRAEISKLQQNYTDFKKLFKMNFLMGMAGIRKIVGKDYIYSGKFSSMLVYSFLNQDAPLGFKYEIKL